MSIKPILTVKKAVLQSLVGGGRNQTTRCADAARGRNTCCVCIVPTGQPDLETSVLDKNRIYTFHGLWTIEEGQA